MASILELQQFAANEQEMNKSPLSFIGSNLGQYVSERNKEKKLLEIMKQKIQMDAEFEAKRIEENNNRIIDQIDRINRNQEIFNSGENKTQVGAINKISKNEQSTRLQRKYTAIPKFSASGEMSLEVKDISEDINKQNKQIFDMASKLRDDFRKSQVFKDFQEIRRAGGAIDTAYNRAISSDVKDKLAADQALVVSFNKMLDPGSVVRESEYARTAEGQAAINSFTGAIQRFFVGGVGLTNEGRKELKLMANSILEKSGETAKKEAEFFGRAADSFNIPRDLVFIEEDFNFDSIPVGNKRKEVDVNITGVSSNLKSKYGLD